jgi:ABC-type uncharacterized transport system ATPase subunit
MFSQQENRARLPWGIEIRETTQMPRSNVVTVSRLSKSFNHTVKAVDEISFTIPEGAVFGFLW